jgi:hypothetical protein
VAEEPERLARCDLEIDAGERLGGAKALDEALGEYG